MLKRTICFIIMLSALALSAPAWGDVVSRGLDTPNNRRDEFISAYGDLPVAEIRIEGLKNTRKKFVRSFITVKAGEPLSGFDGNAVEQGLRSRGIFEKIDISYLRSEPGVVVVIFLKEKYTLIPIPFFKYTDSETMLGLFLVETNFLGMNKMLYGGGYYSMYGGWLLAGGYVDPGLGGGRFVWYARALGGREKFENADPEGSAYRRYMAGYVKVSAAGGYRFTVRSTIYGVLLYNLVHVEPDWDRSLNPPEGGSIIRPAVRYVYKDIVYGEYLSYGFQSTIEYGPGVHLNGPGSVHHRSAARAAWHIPAFSSHRAGFLAFGGFGNPPEIFQDRIGGTIARTLSPRELVAPRYLSSEIEYEIPFQFTDLLVPSLVAFWETGVYDGPGNGAEPFYGPGGGIRVYLKKIALPAFGFNTAYNVETAGVYISVFLGFQF